MKPFTRFYGDQPMNMGSKTEKIHGFVDLKGMLGRIGDVLAR